MATKPVAKTPAKAAAKAPAGKSLAKPVKAATAPVALAETAGEGGAKLIAQLRVKELIDRVIAATDQNRRDVKIIIDATLSELAKALQAGEMLNLPPLGRVRVANQRSDEAGLVMTLKLRRVGEKTPGQKAEKEALAEVGEAG